MKLTGSYWLAVGLGGALGAMARFGVSNWVMRLTAGTFPWGTLVVNVCGSLLLGLLMGFAGGARGPIPPTLQTLFGVGFCGAFTTFSTFSYDTLGVLRGGDPRIAFANVVVHVVCCLIVCWIGLEIGRRL